jgi:hypothetical protein
LDILIEDGRDRRVLRHSLKSQFRAEDIRGAATLIVDLIPTSGEAAEISVIDL